MKRVLAQGDLRPMAGNEDAMDDLKRILAAREPPSTARPTRRLDTARPERPKRACARCARRCSR